MLILGLAGAAVLLLLQQTGTGTGTVHTKMLGEPVPGAEVFVELEPDDEPLANTSVGKDGSGSSGDPLGGGGTNGRGTFSGTLVDVGLGTGTGTGTGTVHTKMLGEPVPGAEVFVELEPDDEPLANTSVGKDGSGSSGDPRGGGGTNGRGTFSGTPVDVGLGTGTGTVHTKMLGEPVPGAEVFVELEPDDEPKISFEGSGNDGSGAGHGGPHGPGGPAQPAGLVGEPVPGAEVFVELEPDDQPIISLEGSGHGPMPPLPPQPVTTSAAGLRGTKPR